MLELLITVALIVTIFVVTFGSRKKARIKAHSAECRRLLVTQFQVLATYAMENDGAFPVVPVATTSEVPLSLLVPKYTTQTEIFVCPGADDRELPPAETFENRRISYGYYMGMTTNAPAATPLVTDEQVNTRPKAAGELTFSSDGKGPGNNHADSGGNVLLLDGSVHQSGVHAEIPLPVIDGVSLLNPKP